MALELGSNNIRANSVCPGYIQTPMSESIDDPKFVDHYVRNKIPLGQVGKVEDVAGVRGWLEGECLPS